MAIEKTTVPAPEAAPVTVADLLKVIQAMQANAPAASGQIGASDLTSLVQSIQAMTPTRKVLFSEFKTKSAFNPTGSQSRKLKCAAYQNGHRFEIETLFDEEIKLLNALPEGRFIQNLVSVRRVEGANGGKDQIRIEYANRSHDQRILIAQHIRSFVSMLRQIHEEAKAKG